MKSNINIEDMEFLTDNERDFLLVNRGADEQISLLDVYFEAKYNTDPGVAAIASSIVQKMEDNKVDYILF